MVLRPGDVVMTRSMYYFLMEYISRIPEVKPEYQQRACDELVEMMKELNR